MLLKNKSVYTAISTFNNADKLVITLRKIGRVTIGVPKRNVASMLFVLAIASSPGYASEPIVEQTQNAIDCREIIDPTARLACFDAASKKLAGLLNSTSEVKENHVPISETPAPVEKIAPQASTEEDTPTWATPPQYTDEERAQDSPEFQATIVRITRNGVGRHRFYTDEGAVWEQTQIVNVRAPKSLPAVAKFKRKMTGNPSIQFDFSSRSYRVRRIE